jgi:hypothetical protein
LSIDAATAASWQKCGDRMKRVWRRRRRIAVRDNGADVTGRSR